jgi:RHS repeat-associated protein
MDHHGPTGSVIQTETRTYNTIGQLTRIQAPSGGGQPAVDLQYTFSATQNNGRIQSLHNAISGETVAYTYDSLNRLINAAKTGGTPWTRAYAYDGWGNLTQMGPSSYTVNPATNRMNGFTFDANGNQANGALSAYDIENRLLKWDNSGEEYRYAPDNRRVFKRTTGSERYYFFGRNGRVEAELYVDWDPNGGSTPEMVLTADSAVYKRHLGYQRIGVNGTGVDDHLAGGAGKYPYGENADRFATHDKDGSTGLHYADQRYYASMHGRFLTPDPYKASGSPRDPGSWNQYSYTRSDPVNRYDPRGLEDEGPPINPYQGLIDLVLTRLRNEAFAPYTEEEEKDPLKRQLRDDKDRLREWAVGAINSLKPDCKDKLANIPVAGGWGLNLLHRGLYEAANGRFIDLQSPTVAYATISQVFNGGGIYPGMEQTVLDYAYKTSEHDPTTWKGWYHSGTIFIGLGLDYSDRVDVQVTLVHEIFAHATGYGHVRLAEALGVYTGGSFQWPPGTNLDAVNTTQASMDLDTWFRSCLKK